MVGAGTELSLVAVNQRIVAPWARRPEVRIGAVVAVAIAAAFVVWLLVKSGDSGTGTTAQTPTVPAISATAASPDRLRELSVDAGHPIYWLGPLPDRTYELTRTSDDRIFVRYLPKGEKVGSDNASFTIVGTYPVPDAYSVLKGLAKKKNEVSFTAPGGALGVYSTTQPTNVYLAYPGSDSQIEVFDPSPTRARGLVTSGQIRPVR
jgi:hypothetical protein